MRKSQILKNEVICFTGKSKYTRVEMERIAKLNGAKTTKHIYRATTLLVVGQRSGCKLDRALEKGIKIVADDAFLDLIHDK